MRVLIARVALASFLLPVAGILADAQTSGQNVQTCLSGRYPSLCNHDALNAEQLKETLAEETRENLKTCMMGRYPTLCDHSKLTSEQLKAVQESETVENLNVCMSGRYPTLCNYSLLSSNELMQVRAAEKVENLKVCMNGHYASLCNHALLTPEEAKSVAAAESAVPQSPPTSAIPKPTHQGRCESGLSIASVADDGKIIKLDDGSFWKVDDVDTVDTALWLAADEVVLCEGKIINTDENESAEVTPITPTRGTTSATRKTVETTSDDEIALYDGSGAAVAYIATSEDLTVYTWTGAPVAYLDGENLYGFNGKHLAWFENGRIYDHQGRVAGTTAEAASGALKPQGIKGFKRFKPFKAFEQFAPLQPILTPSWSQLPLIVLLSAGAK
jgi:hypothetical protein